MKSSVDIRYCPTANFNSLILFSCLILTSHSKTYLPLLLSLNTFHTLQHLLHIVLLNSYMTTFLFYFHYISDPNDVLLLLLLFHPSNKIRLKIWLICLIKNRLNCHSVLIEWIVILYLPDISALSVIKSPTMYIDLHNIFSLIKLLPACVGKYSFNWMKIYNPVRNFILLSLIPYLSSCLKI